MKHLLHAGSRRNQISDPKVVSARHLTEAASRHGHHACGLEHIHAVHKIGLLALFRALIDELLREVQSGESIHSSLNLRARNIGHLIESLSQDLSFVLQSASDNVYLALVQVDAGV